MIMEKMENILNELFAKLLTEGEANFSQDGVNIKTSYDNGRLSISASFVDPVVDESAELIASFEDYINSLSDDFFLEVVETFEDGQLKKIQDKLDSRKKPLVLEGINEFMSHLKALAAEKILEINDAVRETEDTLKKLNEIHASYVHVLHKEFEN